MAKRVRNVGRAQTEFDKVLATIPARAEFVLPMAADSTDEVYVDLDTNLDDGEAWLVYGGWWCLENVVPAVPLTPGWDTQTTGNVWKLQVHRNDDSELLLAALDDDLMFFDEINVDATVATQGAKSQLLSFPRPFGHRTITFSEKLRVLFRTFVDDTTISATSAHIAGCLLYDRIKAPSIGQSKLGQIADL